MEQEPLALGAYPGYILNQTGVGLKCPAFQGKEKGDTNTESICCSQALYLKYWGARIFGYHMYSLWQIIFFLWKLFQQWINITWVFPLNEGQFLCWCPDVYNLFHLTHISPIIFLFFLTIQNNFLDESHIPQLWCPGYPHLTICFLKRIGTLAISACLFLCLNYSCFPSNFSAVQALAKWVPIIFLLCPYSFWLRNHF